MSFNLEGFLKSPKENILTLKNARKEDLRKIAAHAGISFQSNTVKAELLGIILDFLYAHNLGVYCNRPCPLVRRSVGPLVRPSVRPSTRFLFAL